MASPVVLAGARGGRGEPAQEGEPRGGGTGGWGRALSPQLLSPKHRARNTVPCHWAACLESPGALGAGPGLGGEASSASADGSLHSRGPPCHHRSACFGVSIPFCILWGREVTSIPSSVSSQILPFTASAVYSTMYQTGMRTPQDFWVYQDHNCNGLCDAAWGGKEDTWKVCAQARVHTLRVPDSSLCLSPPAGHTTSLAQFPPGRRPWCFRVSVGGGGGGLGELQGLCVSSVLWSNSLWWVWLPQKFHFWELKEFDTFLLCASYQSMLILTSGPKFSSDVYPFFLFSFPRLFLPVSCQQPPPCPHWLCGHSECFWGCPSCTPHPSQQLLWTLPQQSDCGKTPLGPDRWGWQLGLGVTAESSSEQRLCAVFVLGHQKREERAPSGLSSLPQPESLGTVTDQVAQVSAGTIKAATHPMRAPPRALVFLTVTARCAFLTQCK